MFATRVSYQCFRGNYSIVSVKTQMKQQKNIQINISNKQTHKLQNM